MLMKQAKRILRLLTIMLTVAAIGALATSSIQSASAMFSPSVSSNPAPLIVGFGGNLITITAAVDGTQPHEDVRISIAEPTVIIGWGANQPGTPAVLNVNPIPGGTCTLPPVQANPNARSVWHLQTAGVDSLFDIPVGGVVKIPFTGPGAVAIIYSGGATGPATGTWVDQVNAASASVAFVTSGLSLYSGGHCGYDLVGTTGTTNNLYGTVSTLSSQFPVGGSIIPIDTTALMIVGLSSGLVWIFPTIAAGIGIGAAAYKLRRK